MAEKNGSHFSNKNIAAANSINPIVRNLFRTSTSDMRIRHIMKSNINTINASGAMAGATKVVIICQPFKLTAVPGAGGRKAIIKAIAMRAKRRAPKSLIKFIRKELPSIGV